MALSNGILIVVGIVLLLAVGLLVGLGFLIRHLVLVSRTNRLNRQGDTDGRPSGREGL